MTIATVYEVAFSGWAYFTATDDMTIACIDKEVLHVSFVTVRSGIKSLGLLV